MSQRVLKLPMDLFLICSDAALQVAKSVQEVGVEVKTN